jgi:hypothetical protein
VNAGADAVPEPLSDEAAAAMVEVMQRHGVVFVLIGGFAIQLHGVDGLARTADLDVTPRRTAENLRRLAAALTELDARACEALGYRTEASRFHGTPSCSTEWTSRST